MGFCKRDKNQVVLEQDAECRYICGDQLNRTCSKGCQEWKGNLDKRESLSHIHSFKVSSKNPTNWHPMRSSLEIAVIDQPDHSLTYVMEVQDPELDLTSLSPSETRVYNLKYIQGYTHKEICDSLFISRSTLRTHLNNISRKLFRVDKAAAND